MSKIDHKEDIENLVFRIFRREASLGGFGTALTARDVEPFVVHGRKIREMAQNLTPGEASGYLGGYQTETAKELARLVTESYARAYTWSMVSKQKLPFVARACESLQIDVKIGDENCRYVETKLTPGKLEVSLGFDACMMLSLFDLADNVARESRAAAIMSFLMHDSLIQEKQEEEGKYPAAGLAVAATEFSARVGGATGFSSALRVVLEGIEKAQKKNPEFGRYSDAIDEKICEFSGYFERTIVDGKQKGFVAAAKFHDFKKDPETGSVSFDVKTSSFEPTIDGYSKWLASVIELVDLINGGDQGAADKILEGFPEGGGQGSQGDRPQEGQGEGEEEAQDEDGSQDDGEAPTDGERKREIGRFGSDEKSRQIMEALGVKYEAEVCADTPVSWEDIIHGELLKALGEKRVSTWTRPNRRHIGADIYLPGFRRKRVRRVAVGIDESGSIDMEKLKLFNSELIRVIDKINPEGMDVFHFSTSVAEETLTQGEIWEAKRLLNGGTNFKVAYQAINDRLQSGSQYDAIVFFTDMEDSNYAGLKRAVAQDYFPEGTQFIWVVWGDVSRPEFGTMINMDSGEMEEYGAL